MENNRFQVPKVQCPNCGDRKELNQVLTAQSNQNVIYHCSLCEYLVKDIHTSKG